mmetsp:Transcript_72551/g.109464  ORF Transcript_72551/g.109464 Transcript_72551/m.109464 type:complete len:99 (-) Transcript_72551:8-304(-)
MNSLLKLHIVRGDYLKVLEVYRTKILNKFIPDVYSLCYLFDAFGFLGELTELKNEFSSLRMERPEILFPRIMGSYLVAAARCGAWYNVEVEIEEIKKI